MVHKSKHVEQQKLFAVALTLFYRVLFFGTSVAFLASQIRELSSTISARGKINEQIGVWRARKPDACEAFVNYNI